ncbi:MAG: hypothetical protein B7Y08_25495 [Rhodospirillales bacterium 24-66-33]|jgi:group I intron endonuclease|uniref:NUMOD3 domain-containing DNA-binding protein n=3 Tax=Reyranella sp. TaxID=1929291 RepID=UPI000BD98C90|nr:NUMOD3 domain-containing DNA-binding protein [Reyranella sp.]OYY35562.1 MAG: hypothetical protein B7Y57_25625 [Rhodospirillales bacterium 35-66-84]OYZ91432.1 MAG: hypothetical protein B7Y08_25495 [Rhodospirillales bacterium 24-66-33]OZB26262.1 MAG: hypothetical protein B7X63_10005 [Rhodospirillales bacterium 39-66-50]HQS15017.1 GIY-YIG nuclease family protein [Reyranella sp.]HQT10826.1 GIY-YIG nuclease family protein [Reyranella sp.]
MAENSGTPASREAQPPPNASGIYEIVNLANGKRYIGSAVNLRRRWSAHRGALKAGNHVNIHLQRSWNARGAQAFVFAVVEYCDRADLIRREQHHIDALRPEYNLCPRAGSTLGVRRSAEQLLRASAAHLGKRHSAETRAKLSEVQRGRVHSLTTRAKMSATALGRKKSAETRSKISAAALGRIIPIDQRAKIAAAKRGRAHSAETRAKMSASALGRKKSEQTRANMRAAWQRRKAARLT